MLLDCSYRHNGCGLDSVIAGDNGRSSPSERHNRHLPVHYQATRNGCSWRTYRRSSWQSCLGSQLIRRQPRSRVSATTPCSSSDQPCRAEIIKRLRAMTLKLLPIEVDQNTLNDPISRIITPRVISAYNKAAGDFQDAVTHQQ